MSDSRHRPPPRIANHREPAPERLRWALPRDFTHQRLALAPCVLNHAKSAFSHRIKGAVHGNAYPQHVTASPLEHKVVVRLGRCPRRGDSLNGTLAHGSNTIVGEGPCAVKRLNRNFLDRSEVLGTL